MLDLNQVTVPSLDVARSILLFYEKLGLKLIVHTHDAYARFECPVGTSTFSIHLVNEIQQGEGAAVYFECGALDDYVTFLENSGVVIDQPPTDQPWLWREARLRDPDGNTIILFTAGKNRKYPPWRQDG